MPPVGDPALGHPASRARLSRPSAPAPLAVTIAVDGCLLACAVLMALADARWWIFLMPLGVGAVILAVYGRKAATALGIRSREETPRGWLTAMGAAGGLAGVLAAHTGRYAGLVIVAYLTCGHIVERMAWTRFRASSQIAEER
jgi:hypothetical protein